MDISSARSASESFALHRTSSARASSAAPGGASPTERLAALAEAAQARIQNLKENGNLTGAQIDALTAASEEFAAAIDRLGAAWKPGGPERDVLLRGFQSIMENLRDDVSASLQMTEPRGTVEAPVRGTTADGVAAPRADAEEAGAEVGPQNAAGGDRLGSAQADIAARMQHLIGSQRLDRGTVAALEAAHTEFGSILDRLGAAMSDGGLSPEQAGRAFAYALGTLQAHVHELLGESGTTPTPNDPASEPGALDRTA